MGGRTLLLEADLRRSNLAAHYRLPPGPGLSELLTGGATPSEAIRSVPIASRLNGARSEVLLDVLVAGHAPPNPTELLESHAMADVLAWARENYDLVVIDTPPLAVVADAMALLNAVDGVVLVGEVGKNTRDAAAFLRERLVGVGAPVLGVVANGLSPKRRAAYGYGYRGYDSVTPAGMSVQAEESTQAGA
jgi:capsular exopolysaccharide synthesis family protein